MGYRAATAAHRILLKELDGSDNWVDIREGRSYGMMMDGLARAGLVTGISAYGTPQYASIDLKSAALALLEQSVLAWSLRAEDSDAEPMPLERESYENLPEQVAVFLNQRIQAHYQTRLPSEEEKKRNGTGALHGAQ